MWMKKSHLNRYRNGKDLQVAVTKVTPPPTGHPPRRNLVYWSSDREMPTIPWCSFSLGRLHFWNRHGAEKSSLCDVNIFHTGTASIFIVSGPYVCMAAHLAPNPGQHYRLKAAWWKHTVYGWFHLDCSCPCTGSSYVNSYVMLDILSPKRKLRHVGPKVGPSWAQDGSWSAQLKVCLQSGLGWAK